MERNSPDDPGGGGLGAAELPGVGIGHAGAAVADLADERAVLDAGR